METLQTVPELIAAAVDNAKKAQSVITRLQEHSDWTKGADAHSEELRAAYVELEHLAVDTFSVFEARMQHHFKRGPFSRKLKALLVDAGQTDLATRVHQYYLAINVLKHGTGASYRELRDNPKALFPVKSVEDTRPADPHAVSGLVDVGVSSFFDGLAITLLEAHQFLTDQ